MTVTLRRYKNGGWEVDVRVMRPDGTRVRERRRAPMKSKTAARRWGEARAAHLALHGKEKPRPPVPRLREFFPRFLEEHCRANGHKPSGITGKEQVFAKHLDPTLGRMRLDAIGPAEIAKLKASLRDKAPATVNNVLTVLSMVFRCAVDWGVIESHPPVKMLKTATHAPDVYSFEEYEALVAAAGKVSQDVLAVVLLAGDAGLRRGEILALRPGDVRLEEKQLCVERSEWSGNVTPTKGMEHRVVPCTARLAGCLETMDLRMRDRVIEAADGRRATAQTLRHYVARAQREAGLPAKGSLHRLRRTFCSHLAMRGAAPMTVQHLAGHQDLQTTLKYVRISEEEARRAIGLLEGA